MQQENHLLQKRVNLFDGVSIVAGAMIGSGIFIVSAGHLIEMPLSLK
jgi:serine acetyltransferase